MTTEHIDLPDQPDGIEDDSRDLPDPLRAAERVGEYIAANGDGMYDRIGNVPLYARDLEALRRAAVKAGQLRRRIVAELVAALEGTARNMQGLDDPVYGQWRAAKREGYLEAAGSIRHFYDRPEDTAPAVETVSVPGVSR